MFTNILNNKIDSKNVLLILAILATLFPYVSIVFFTPSDLQPLALCLCSFVLIFNYSDIKAKKHHYLFWVTITCITFSCVYAFSKLLSDSAFTFRSTMYYLSILVFFIFGSLIGTSELKIGKIVFYASLVWLFFGLIQKFYIPNFGYFLMNSPRTMSDRGVVSLSSEPSSYSVQLLFLTILNWVSAPSSHAQLKKGFLSIPKWRLTEWILVFQAVFLSQSFMGILLFCVFFAFRFFAFKPILSLSTCGVLISIYYLLGDSIGSYLYSIRTEGRIVDLTAKLFLDPQSLIISDRSGSERASDIILSYYGFFKEFPFNLGSGTVDWPRFVSESIGNFSFLNHSATGSRIMSGIGAALFELGWAGVILLFAFLIQIFSLHKKSVVTALTFLIVLNSSIPLALPLVGLILGFNNTKAYR